MNATSEAVAPQVEMPRSEIRELSARIDELASAAFVEEHMRTAQMRDSLRANIEFAAGHVRSEGCLPSWEQVTVGVKP